MPQSIPGLLYLSVGHSYMFFELQHSSTEIIWMIQKAFRDNAMSAAQIKVGTNTSKMVENLLKVIRILEDLQQAGRLRMLIAYGLQSMTSLL